MASHMMEPPSDGGSESEEHSDKDDHVLASSCLSLDDALIISKRGNVRTFRASPQPLSPPVSPLHCGSPFDVNVPLHTPTKKPRLERSHSTPYDGDSCGFELEEIFTSPSISASGLTPIFAANAFLDTPQKRKTGQPHDHSQSRVHPNSLVRNLQFFGSLQDSNNATGISPLKQANADTISAGDSGISEGLSATDTDSHVAIRDEIELAIKMISRSNSRPPTPDVFEDDNAVVDASATGIPTMRSDTCENRNTFQLLRRERMMANMLSSPVSTNPFDASKTSNFSKMRKSKSFDLGKISALKGSCTVSAKDKIHTANVKTVHCGNLDIAVSTKSAMRQNVTSKNVRSEKSRRDVAKFPIPFTGLRPKLSSEQAVVSPFSAQNVQVPIGIARPMPVAVSTTQMAATSYFSVPVVSTACTNIPSLTTGHAQMMQIRQPLPAAPGCVFSTPTRNLFVLNGPFRVVSVPGVGNLSPAPMVYLNPMQSSVTPLTQLSDAGIPTRFQDFTPQVQTSSHPCHSSHVMIQSGPTIYTGQATHRPMTLGISEDTFTSASVSSVNMNKNTGPASNVTWDAVRVDEGTYMDLSSKAVQNYPIGFTCASSTPVDPTSTAGMPADHSTMTIVPSAQAMGYQFLDGHDVPVLTQSPTPTSIPLARDPFLVQPYLRPPGITPLYSVRHQTAQFMCSPEIPLTYSSTSTPLQSIHQPPTAVSTLSRPSDESQTIFIKAPTSQENLSHTEPVPRVAVTSKPHKFGAPVPTKDAGDMRTQAYDIFSLQIGACKVSWPDHNSQRPLNSEVKLDFSERKLLYQFEMQDEFTEDRVISSHFLMLTIEVNFRNIVGLMGSDASVALEVVSSPLLDVTKSSIDAKGNLVMGPPNNNGAYKVLPTIELQLKTSPYHWITLMRPVAEEFKWHLSVFDQYFSKLQLQPFIVNSRKVLNQSSEIVPSGNHTPRQHLALQDTVALNSDRLRVNRGCVGRCACMRGCQYSRCSCVLNLRLCTQRCACINKYHCSNPLNQLANIGIDPDEVLTDPCLVFNISKVRNFQEYLSDEVKLPCCKIRVAKQDLVPGLAICPEPGCNRAYCYSWCSESLCDEDRQPRNHCLECNKCLSSRATHCFDCGECYVSTARKPVCQCHVRAGRKNPPQPMRTISIPDLIKRDSLNSSVHASMKCERSQTKGDIVGSGARLNCIQHQQEEAISTSTATIPPNSHRRKRALSGPPSYPRNDFAAADNACQSSVPIGSTENSSHLGATQPESPITAVTNADHAAGHFTKIRKRTDAQNQGTDLVPMEDDVFPSDAVSKSIHVEITKLGSQAPRSTGKGMHILMPVLDKAAEARFVLGNEGAVMQNKDEVNVSKQLQTDALARTTSTQSGSFKLSSEVISSKLNLLRRCDEIPSLPEIHGARKMSIRGSQIRYMPGSCDDGCPEQTSVETIERPQEYKRKRRNSSPGRANGPGRANCLPRNNSSSFISKVFSHADKDSCVLKDKIRAQRVGHVVDIVPIFGDPRLKSNKDHAAEAYDPLLTSIDRVTRKGPSNMSTNSMSPIIGAFQDSEDVKLRSPSPVAKATIHWK